MECGGTGAGAGTGTGRLYTLSPKLDHMMGNKQGVCDPHGYGRTFLVCANSFSL